MTTEEDNFCLRPSEETKVRLRLHHRGKFVSEPVKLYVGGEVNEMDWKWDVDFMSYMDLEALIKSHGYVDINSLWYRNPKFNFTRGLRPLNNDNDVLHFAEDVVGYEVIDVYVEHKVCANPEILDPSELHNIVDDDDVVCIGVNLSKDQHEPKHTEQPDCEDNNVQDEVNVQPEVNVQDEVNVKPEVNVQPELSESDSEKCEDMDWTKVLPAETVSDVSSGSNLQHEDVDDEDEDNLYTPPGSDDDEGVAQFPSYKSGEGCALKLGVMFANKETIRDAIKEYGMENQKNVFIKKNDAKRIVVRCMAGCDFYIRISRRNGQQFWQIVSYVGEHTCYRTADNRNAKTDWLAKRFAHILRYTPYMKPTGLVAEALQRWGVKISSDQAYRAKRRAMDLIQCAGIEQFSHLRSYAEELLKSNPKSTVFIKCAENNGSHVFERIYICLEACKSGFANTCRPLIVLDACFLKGEYGGQLMSAVGRDGNNQIYSIAYAVVEVETKDSWEWFLNLLLEDLSSFNQRAYGFISDQQKGLVPAIQGLSAHVEQRLCVKHLYGNWKKKHSGLELKEVMWAAARATTIPLWERSMEKMKLINEGAWKDMKDTPAKFWTRSHFQTYTKCDLQVNNMCKAFNRAILEHRDKPIITLLEGIKHYITKRITKQKELLQGYEGSLCPRIQMLIEKNKKQAQLWTPTWHGDDDLSIFGVTDGIETYCVNLKTETCSCRKWDLTGIPCTHAISCIWSIKKKPESYVSHFYSKSTFEKTYANIVFPTNGPQLWPIVENMPICPPVMRIAIGRPKKMRNKATDEPKNPHVLPRKFATVTCQKCGQTGHNKRSCKGKRAADRAIPKGGNMTKKAKSTRKGKTTRKKKTQDEIGQGSQAPQATQD